MSSEIHTACSSGDLEAIKEVLRGDPDAINHELDGYTPVQRAIPAHPDALTCLLEAGEDANRLIDKVHWFQWEDVAVKQGLPHWRLIHMAALHGYHDNSTRTIEILGQFGADLTQPSPFEGYTALHLAAIPNGQHVVQCLVENGVDVDIRATKIDTSIDWSQLMNTTPFQPFDGFDRTPLMVACGEGHFQTAQTLIALGADVSAEDASGHTPLHYAAGGFWSTRQHNYVAIVRLLRQHAASLDAKDAQGRRPVDLALTKNYHGIVVVLEGDA